MSNRGKILIVEDSFSTGMLCVEYLEKVGFSVKHVETGSAGFEEFENRKYDLILLDVGLPDCSGIDILKSIKAKPDSPAVIVISAQGSIKMAVEAMKLGSDDFLMKPFNEHRLVTSVKNTLERNQLKNTISAFQASEAKNNFHGFIGQSLPMQVVYRAIENVASSTASIFITGESGTGKEVCAEAIHAAGDRRSKAFVPLNCAAIPSNLIESEIFGHLKGSFTGAVSDRMGAAMVANGGTLFLDEICEMDTNLQAKLLRFLQTKKVQRVGSDRLEQVDVRIICATNRDPMEDVETGRLREDLFYRLNVIPIHMPPLRDRDNDVCEIASHFLGHFSNIEKKQFDGFTDAVKNLINHYTWPGNVRELKNIIHQVTVMNSGGTIGIEMLSGLSVGPRLSASSPRPSHGDFVDLSNAGTLDDIIQTLINDRIMVCDGSIPKAAASLGLSPSTIYRKMDNWKDKHIEQEEI